MQLGGLGARVGGGVLAGYERVLGRDEDDRAAATLRPQDAERLARDQEVAGAEDRLVAVPLGQRGVLDRRAGGDARVGDHDVDTAERVDRGGERLATAVLGGDVAGDRDAAVAERRDRVARRRRRRCRTPTMHAPAPHRTSTIARPMPPAAPVTSATLPCSSPGGGASESLYSSSGQYSIAKLSASVERDELGERARSGHHLDRAVVEIAREPAALAVVPAATSPTFWISITRGSGSAGIGVASALRSK